MAKAYWVWSNDDKLVFERDGNDGHEPMRLLFHGEGDTRTSQDFTTAELQRLRGWLNWVLEKRNVRLAATCPTHSADDDSSGLFD